MRDIKDFEGLYSVTENGEVFSWISHRIIAQNTHSGYSQVELYRKGRRYVEYVHRLVAQAFIPNPENKPEVNHKDGCKNNNHFSNLEWNTKSENNIHAYKEGIRTINCIPGIGKRMVEQLSMDGILINAYSSISEAAQINNFQISGISRCCSGKNFNWCFRYYMSGFHTRFSRYPKNPRDPKSIKRKAYMQTIADRYGITSENPFNGVFYFETLQQKQV